MATVCAVALVAAGLAACGTSKVKTSTPKSPGGDDWHLVGHRQRRTPRPAGRPGPHRSWSQTAVKFRGQNGKSYQITCTSHGTSGPVWGTGPYTDDSSICTAAVQSGLITLAKGGTVTYQIAPGQDSYAQGSAHGVTSQSYASWDGSFTFPAASSGATKTGPDSWSQTMTSYANQKGKQVTVVCSSQGTVNLVWGSGPFTDDSSVCSAAVYAGLITVADGGTVVATVAPGQQSYKGGTAHGVTSEDYGSWGASFTLSTP